MNHKLKIIGALCLSAITTVATSATANWDTETLKPQIDALNKIGWSILPLGTGFISVSGLDGTNPVQYKTTAELNVNTGMFTITVVEEGPFYGHSFYGSLNTSNELFLNTAQLLESFLNNAKSISNAGAATFSTSQTLTSLALTGAHHRPLMTTPFPKEVQCMWLTGDFAKNNDENLNQQLAEIGACKDFANGAVRVGAGLGINRASQDLAFGGKLNFNGNHLMAEIDYRTATDFLFSLTGIYGKGDSDIRRNYPALSSQSTDTSNSRTTTSTVGARVRADWLDAMKIGKAGLTPYIAYSQMRTHQDGYAETGGTSPARYDAITLHTKETLVGIVASMPATPQTYLSLSVEGIHRFNAEDMPPITGQAIGLPAFSIPSPKPDENYWRLGIDVDHQLNKKSIIAVSAHAANNQPGPTWSGSVSWRLGF